SGSRRSTSNCPRAERSWTRSGEKRTVCPTANLRAAIYRLSCRILPPTTSGRPASRRRPSEPVQRRAVIDALGQALVFERDPAQMLLDRQRRRLAGQFPDAGGMPPVVVGWERGCGRRVIHAGSPLNNLRARGACAASCDADAPPPPARARGVPTVSRRTGAASSRGRCPRAAFFA